MTTGQVELLSGALRRQAAVRPDDPAIVEGGVVRAWSALDAWADVIAARLRAAMATDVAGSDGDRAAGDSGALRIGLAVRPDALGVAAVHGAARTGLTTVLINPRLTAAEIASLLETAGAPLLVAEAAGEVDVPTGFASLVLAGPGDVTSDLSDDGPRRGLSAADPGIFVVATSGSTTQPKLARLTLDALAASAVAWNEVLPPATGWLLSLGLSHVAGLGIVGRAALAGVPIVIPASTDAAGLLEGIERACSKGITVSHLSLVASQLAALLDATGDAPAPNGLRAVVLGGGPIPEALVRRAIRAGWPVVPSYGMTETASGVVALTGDELASGAGTVGRPLPGVDLRLDGDEVVVRGPMLFSGYLDDEAATTAALDEAGWLHTADRGTFDEAGRLIVLGRGDDVIIRGGENIAPGEVEAAIAAHPEVAEVAVVGVADVRWGQVPVAAVVPVAGTELSDAELRSHARARLAGFKVPARFALVDALPRSTIGKVARPELQRLVLTTPSTTTVTTDDGQALVVRELGDRAGPTVVLLHATLSTSDQLLPLARRLATRARVVLIDRRGSGASVMSTPAPVPVERHARDVAEVVARLEIERAVLVGHSFGGVVALRSAVATPSRVAGLLVWEPPYLGLAPPSVQRGMRTMTARVQERFASEGPEAAARLFLEGVAGAGAWDRLQPRQRAAIGREGSGVLADVAMDGLTADGLDAIRCPTIIATGGASEPFYRPIAEALAERIGPSATRIDLPGLRHTAPITNAEAVADLVLRLVLQDDAATPATTTTPATLANPAPATQPNPSEETAE